MGSLVKDLLININKLMIKMVIDEHLVLVSMVEIYNFHDIIILKCSI